MTDTGAALWILLLIFSMSAVVNLTLLVSLLRPWWIAIKTGANGPRTVILRGTLRRRVISLIIHVALIVQFGARVVRGRPSPPLVAAVVFLVLILGLAADAMGDMFDYRLLRGLLRERDAP